VRRGGERGSIEERGKDGEERSEEEIRKSRWFPLSEILNMPLNISINKLHKAWNVTSVTLIS